MKKEYIYSRADNTVYQTDTNRTFLNRLDKTKEEVNEILKEFYNQTGLLYKIKEVDGI